MDGDWLRDEITVETETALGHAEMLASAVESGDLDYAAEVTKPLRVSLRRVKRLKAQLVAEVTG